MSLSDLIARGESKGLDSLKLTELRLIAASQGLRGISGMRKGELIAVIQGEGRGSVQASSQPTSGPRTTGGSSPSRSDRPGDAQAPTPNPHGDNVTSSSQDAPTRQAGQDAAPAPQHGDRADEGGDQRGDSHARGSRGHDQGDGNTQGDAQASETRRTEGRRVYGRRAAEFADRDERDNRDHRDERDNRDHRGWDSRSEDESQDSRGGRGGRDRYEDQDNRGEGRRNRRNRRNRRGRQDRDTRDNRDNGETEARGNRGDRADRDQNNDRGQRGNRRDRDNGPRSQRNRRQRGGEDQDFNRDNGRDNGRDNSQDQGGPATVPVAGILDFADANNAFIRTTGYHAGPTDVYVPMATARKFGMRHGDYVTGSIKPRSNAVAQNNPSGNNRARNRQKYIQIHSVETVNGLSPEDAAQRPDFAKLTPLYPNQRLRLETDPKTITTRVIDLVMPIGKGQRALIVSPPKAGKTTILQSIANAIATNNPECYLMVVLVDERPEEVTDMQRSVRGEVISSTFDRPPSEHTAVAELAIERAKRLVEQGQDVVVLLDSITRLGRAYNNCSPASGRILSGGVDSNALYPPKRFLGAARNIEKGGSLTIIATAMVETGSAGDTVIFEEFKGTGNAELKLDRKISERRVFPAVDVNPSGTRKDELLLGPEEARIMHKLRRILSALDPQAAIDLLIKQLRKNPTNRDFMLQVASSAALADEDLD